MKALSQQDLATLTPIYFNFQTNLWNATGVYLGACRTSVWQAYNCPGDPGDLLPVCDGDTEIEGPVA